MLCTVRISQRRKACELVGVSVIILCVFSISLECKNGEKLMSDIKEYKNVENIVSCKNNNKKETPCN